MPLPLSAPESLSFLAIIYYRTTDGQFAEFQRGYPPASHLGTREHLRFSKTDGKGRGAEGQIPVKTLGLSKVCFFCFSLFPSAFSQMVHIGLSSLPNLLTASYSSISHQQRLKLPIW